MPPPPNDKRSPVALGFEWASRVTTVALEMVLPGIGGQWLDKRWGTSFLALLGFAIGVTAGVVHLLAMVKQSEKSKNDESRD